jgi:hypothetical protein
MHQQSRLADSEIDVGAEEMNAVLDLTQELLEIGAADEARAYPLQLSFALSGEATVQTLSVCSLQATANVLAFDHVKIEVVHGAKSLLFCWQLYDPLGIVSQRHRRTSSRSACCSPHVGQQFQYALIHFDCSCFLTARKMCNRDKL